jgi:hypothetical protein
MRRWALLGGRLQAPPPLECQIGFASTLTMSARGYGRCNCHSTSTVCARKGSSRATPSARPPSVCPVDSARASVASRTPRPPVSAARRACASCAAGRGCCCTHRCNERTLTVRTGLAGTFPLWNVDPPIYHTYASNLVAFPREFALKVTGVQRNYLKAPPPPAPRSAARRPPIRPREPSRRPPAGSARPSRALGAA